MYLLHFSSSLTESCMKLFLIFMTYFINFTLFLHFHLMISLFLWQSITLKFLSNLFEEAEGNPAQCPVTQQSSGCHHLILVNPQEFLHIFKKALNVPTYADVL